MTDGNCIKQQTFYLWSFGVVTSGILKMATYVRVEMISCDRCEFYDSEEKFPDVYTPEGMRVLERLGFDLSNPSDIGHIQTLYAGAICPVCGNFSELDFDQDNNSLERLVEEPEPAFR